ncbi:MAG TPA: nucleotide exchange factor GrpE, partial [Chroococcales cyanobacterium]
QSLANVTDPAQFLSSFDLVFNRFTKCMEGLGIKQMEVVGEQFDPRLHEPVQEIETQEYPDNAVVHELRRGYMIKDKVLRPTLVNVASNPSGVVIKKEAPAPAAAAEAAPAKAEAPASETNPAPAVEAKPAESAPTEAKPAEATPAEAKAAEAAPVQPAAEPEAKSEEKPEAKPEVKAEAPPAKEEPAPAKAEEPAAAAPTEPVAAAAEAPAEPAKEDAKAEGSTRQRKDTKSRAKQSETGDLSGALFDATSTADLPIFEIDQIGQGLFSSDDEDDFEQLSSKIEGEAYELKDAEASTAAVSDKSDSGKESDE